MANDNKEWLSQLRNQIDEIDESIQNLISQRAQIADEVAKSKSKAVSRTRYVKTFDHH